VIPPLKPVRPYQKVIFSEPGGCGTGGTGVSVGAAAAGVPAAVVAAGVLAAPAVVAVAAGAVSVAAAIATVFVAAAAGAVSVAAAAAVVGTDVGALATVVGVAVSPPHPLSADASMVTPSDRVASRRKGWVDFTWFLLSETRSNFPLLCFLSAGRASALQRATRQPRNELTLADHK
jgi:hypothetical protein